MLFLKLKPSIYKIYQNKREEVQSLRFGIPASKYLGNLTTGKAVKMLRFQPYTNIENGEEIINIGHNKEVVVKTNKDLPVWTNIEFNFLINPNCSRGGRYVITFELVSILNPQEYEQLKTN